MAFQGSLAELPLPDILQLVAVSGKTGSFTIQNDRESGRIFLSDGQIVHAEIGNLEGEEAVYELAIWPEGEFHFTPGRVETPTTIDKSNTSLLMEAARRIDEWQVLAKQVPSTGLVPVFTNQDTASTLSLSPEEWKIVRKIDERRNIEEIAEAAGLSPFETSKILFGLITNGLVELKDNVRYLPTDRLAGLDVDQMLELATRVRHEASAFLAGHGKAEQLQGTMTEALQQFEANVDAENLVELIRAAERAVSTALGPNQAKSFMEMVGALVGGRRAGDHDAFAGT